MYRAELQDDKLLINLKGRERTWSWTNWR